VISSKYHVSPLILSIVPPAYTPLPTWIMAAGEGAELRLDRVHADVVQVTLSRTRGHEVSNHPEP
jgi:hypothetical protein